ncbi:MAG: hypothetical protein NTY00_04545 [Deltaproteobacteria bacterium]|nr:hypothetical protein [Deltaproteobacteria bacterium]
MSFYVVRNLGRDIDWLAGENETMLDEIERYWAVFKESKDGTEQIVELK